MASWRSGCGGWRRSASGSSGTRGGTRARRGTRAAARTVCGSPTTSPRGKSIRTGIHNTIPPRNIVFTGTTRIRASGIPIRTLTHRHRRRCRHTHRHTTRLRRSLHQNPSAALRRTPRRSRRSSAPPTARGSRSPTIASWARVPVSSTCSGRAPRGKVVFLRRGRRARVPAPARVLVLVLVLAARLQGPRPRPCPRRARQICRAPRPRSSPWPASAALAR